jgi:transcriptional regulator with PAS, ATPase and Fis domain
VAREIHENSLRRTKPYVKVNCAAIPDTLLESEFFGHERGAFTGANAKRIGRFELAHGGTLLLDEVTEIGLPLQAKLLRALQEREIERVGGNRIVKVDVRIIATTNRDLRDAVDSKQFREDLYYRLNVVPIHVPALRDRRGDTEFLLRYFLEMFAGKHGKPVPAVNVLTMAQLCEYTWPGNVRELRNYAERAIILSEPGRELEMGDHALPGGAEGAFISAANGEFPSLAEVEKRLIMLALKKTSGQRNEAAKILGINVRTLRNKLHEYAEQGDAIDEQGSAVGSPPDLPAGGQVTAGGGPTPSSQPPRISHPMGLRTT